MSKQTTDCTLVFSIKRFILFWIARWRQWQHWCRTDGGSLFTCLSFGNDPWQFDWLWLHYHNFFVEKERLNWTHFCTHSIYISINQNDWNTKYSSSQHLKGIAQSPIYLHKRKYVDSSKLGSFHILASNALVTRHSDEQVAKNRTSAWINGWCTRACSNCSRAIQCPHRLPPPRRVLL